MKVIFLWAEIGSYLHSLAKSVYKFTNQKVSIVNCDKSFLNPSRKTDWFIFQDQAIFLQVLLVYFRA